MAGYIKVYLNLSVMFFYVKRWLKMDIQVLTRFFLWCSLINGGFFLLASLIIMLRPDFIFNIHSRIFKISREQFNMAVYGFLGLMKVVFLVFNLTPYIALLIIQSN